VAARATVALFPYTTLFRSGEAPARDTRHRGHKGDWRRAPQIQEAQEGTESGHEQPRRRQRPPLAVAQDEPRHVGRREVREVERARGELLAKKAEGDGAIESKAVGRQPALSDEEAAV